MLIRIKKGKNKKDLLTCHREDGTTSEIELMAGAVFHELCHYAVETTLGYSQGLFGTIASGKDIEEYNLPNEKRSFQISKEGYYAEFLATLVQASVGAGEINEDYAAILRENAEMMNLPFPKIPRRKTVQRILKLAGKLEFEWADLPISNVMELEFPES